jgi:hypothetical protein
MMECASRYDVIASEAKQSRKATAVAVWIASELKPPAMTVIFFETAFG